MSIRESAIERAACEFATTRGWFWCKFVSPTRRGMPDRFYIRRGVVVFIEYKAPGEVPTPQQSRAHEILRQHGATVHWVDNLDDAKRILA